MLKHKQIELDAIDAKIKKSGRGQHPNTHANITFTPPPKHTAAPGENPFPVGVLPVSLRLIVHEYTRVTGTPTDFLAGAMLTVAGAVIGNSVRGKAGPHPVIATLFMCGVANSGTGKTHPQKTIALTLLERMDDESYKDYRVLHDRWKAAAGADKAKKNKEPEPKLKLTVLTKATPEAVITMHEANPNGLLYYKDEITALFNSFNQYSKGDEAEMWLEIFNGSTIMRATKTAGNVRINKPHISILGNIPPTLLPKLAANNRVDSGFMHRFLFIYPANCEAMPLVFEDVKYDAWNECITTIKQMLSGHDHENPVMIEPTPEAMKVLLNCDTRLMNEANRTTDETTKGILAKLRVYLHRFALILQAMECACTGEAFTEINKQAAAGAVKLVQYFQFTAGKVHGAISKEALISHDIRRVHKLKLEGKTVREIVTLTDLKKWKVEEYLHRKL